MNQTLTVILQSGPATWFRELSQEQVQAIGVALWMAQADAAELATECDECGDGEGALAWQGRAALYEQAREAWLDIAHADREEG